MAEGITGAVEVIESSTDSKGTDATGQSTSAKTNSFFQRYQLFYADTLFPYVNLRAGGSFDKTLTVTKDQSGETRSTDTNLMPSIDLTLNNPFVSSGAGYRKREEKVETTGGPAVTNILESKNAFLGLRPEGLPTLDLLVARTHTFDKAHESTDTENDSFSASTRYTPVKNLDLAYSVTSNDNNNRLSGVDSATVAQNERVGYSNRFLDNRVIFSANYNGTQSTQTTQSGGTGNVNFQLFPFAGLSDISATPTLEVLSPNPALIDGNLTTSSGINIGQSVFPDTRYRNIGLDFVNATEVNTLDVFVDQSVSMPAVFATTNFTWDIYISSDNQNWTLHQASATTTFDPFTNRFELSFPNVTTRYIKASVRPLSAAVVPPSGSSVSNINITELRAFISKPASEAAGKTRQTTEFYDMNVRTALLEDRSLYYTFYYSHASSKPGSSTTFMSNALSFTRQLSTVFSGAARVARDDTRDVTGSTLAYSGSASLMAVPLPTVNNSLVLSGRTEETPQGQTSSTESVFLNNSATLYRGFDVNLSGGLSLASPAVGPRTKNTIVNAGASIVPNKSLSMSVNHSATESQTATGPNRADTTTAGIAWAPFETVYLAYTFTEVSATGVQNARARNYTASWAPFSSGTLSFSSGYSETVQSAGLSGTTGLAKTLSFGMEWRVGPRILLTTGYSVSKSRLLSESTESKNLSSDLRMSF